MRIDSLSYLPQFIIQNPDIKELLEAEQNEIDLLEDYVELIRNQVYISSASIYLDRYEKMFGLEVNESLSVQERSAKILAKLNTRTNSTVEAIKTVVSSISKCSTDIEEYYDSYTFMIDIIRDNNDIINIEDIKFAVDIIKPAHLAYRIQMCYKMVLGILVKTTIYKVAHDVCSDYGGDLDYCGETPDLSYLANIDNISMNASADSECYKYPYQFAGVFPQVSTIGKSENESTMISVDVDNHQYDYDMDNTEAGKIPYISTLGLIDQDGAEVKVSAETFSSLLDFSSLEAGIVPDISTLGQYDSEDGFIQEKTENYIAQKEYCRDDDFCGDED